MIKKIFWTAVIVIFGVSMFQAGNVIASIDQLIDSIKVVADDVSKVMPWLTLIWKAIVLLLWIAPFWFVWKGTKLFKIPVIGFILRLVIYLLLFGIIIFCGSIGADSPIYMDWYPQAAFWSSVIVLLLSLLGVWVFK